MKMSLMCISSYTNTKWFYIYSDFMTNTRYSCYMRDTKEENMILQVRINQRGFYGFEKRNWKRKRYVNRSEAGRWRTCTISSEEKILANKPKENKSSLRPGAQQTISDPFNPILLNHPPHTVLGKMTTFRILPCIRRRWG